MSQSLAPQLLHEITFLALPLILSPRLPLLKIFLHTIIAGNAGVAHVTEGVGTAHDLTFIAT